MTRPIKIETLRELVSAGSVQSATIMGQKGGYAVLVDVGMQQRPLGTKYGKARMFATTDTAVKALREIGMQRFKVDVTHYEPGSLRPGRPDTTRRAKEAAHRLEHDRWFRDQVQRTKAAIEAGTEPLIDGDTLWAELTAEAERMDATRRARK
ncbi:hypothetical protein [Aerosticca soli]|jgi:hypothetical protein|uniref:Prevent host death protein n=1 Tax=Aerosticca soli TaxID=2010829 RepID=A0A2Z6E7S9_9GAMM|nr:hypothetical protein [Aerosticca soli]BBD80761.1 prevent host death protein [Aerosticca soli]